MQGTAIVIDDDPDIADVFSELLSLQGIEILGIGYNGVDAINLFSQKSPSIVFMDVHMPKLNGIEALKRIKKESPESTVVMVTGDLSSDLVTTLEDIGANTIIHKPFNMDKILNVLREIQKSNKMVTQI